MIKNSKYIVALICVMIVIARLIYPEINFDLISLTLVAIATFAILIQSPQNFFKNTKKIKLGSFEFELQELNKETEKVEESIVIEKNAPVGLSGSQTENISENYEMSNDFTVDILKISINIEKTLREIYEIHFKYKQDKPFSLNRLIEKLKKENVIDIETTLMLKKFWDLRNKVIHNQDYILSKKDFMSFIDIGLRIMKILNNIKNEKLDGKMKHIGLN
jgi:uncharacterized protein YutE (UPF0331/DUF86 family)